MIGAFNTGGSYPAGGAGGGSAYIPPQRAFIPDSDLAPVNPGEPTLDEVQDYVTDHSIKDTVVFYTGTNDENDPVKYSYYADGIGTVTQIDEPNYVPKPRVFAEAALVSALDTQNPTLAEIQSFIQTNDIKDTIVFYTGTNDQNDEIRYIYSVDANGVATMIYKPSVLPNDDVFLMAADIPADDVDNPTVDEVASYISTTDLRDTIAYYTGTNDALDEPTYLYHIDYHQNVREIESPTLYKQDGEIVGQRTIKLKTNDLKFVNDLGDTTTISMYANNIARSWINEPKMTYVGNSNVVNLDFVKNLNQLLVIDSINPHFTISLSSLISNAAWSYFQTFTLSIRNQTTADTTCSFTTDYYDTDLAYLSSKKIASNSTVILTFMQYGEKLKLIHSSKPEGKPLKTAHMTSSDLELSTRYATTTSVDNATLPQATGSLKTIEIVPTRTISISPQSGEKINGTENLTIGADPGRFILLVDAANGEWYCYTLYQSVGTPPSNPAPSGTVSYYDIGVPGTQGFGVGVIPQSDIPSSLNLEPMPGTEDIASDEYGNYYHTQTGSTMVFIPKFYFRITGNDIDIRKEPAPGYVVHRAFINAGAEIDGIFVAKYAASKSGSNVYAKQNLVPASLSDFNGGVNALTAIKNQYGNDYFIMPAFYQDAVAKLTWAHSRASTSTQYCAWRDVQPYFPKTCSASGLKDYDDGSVTFTSIDGSSTTRAKTGSGHPFEKTTHNGQKCGITDISLGYYTLYGFENSSSNVTRFFKTSLDVRSYTASNYGDNSLFDEYYPSNDLGGRLGNGANQVFMFTEDTSSIFYLAMCSGVPNDDGISSSGTNDFGKDFIYIRTSYSASSVTPYSVPSGTAAGVFSMNRTYSLDASYADSITRFAATL